MFFKSPFVFKGAFKAPIHPKILPPWGIVVMIGRSNVGKSSLVNAVTEQSKLAKVSKTPGRTQEIIYFQNTNFFLVDLPGYGFAKRAKSLRDEWAETMPAYLLSIGSPVRADEEPLLRRIFMLIDARLGDLQDADRQMLDWLREHELPVQIVLTKCEKIKPAELVLMTTTIAQLYQLALPVLTTSALNRDALSVQKAIKDIFPKA